MQALSGIGLVIFTALDFGLGEDQERALSIDLETLLDLLASEGTILLLNESGQKKIGPNCTIIAQKVIMEFQFSADFLTKRPVQVF